MPWTAVEPVEGRFAEMRLIEITAIDCPTPIPAVDGPDVDVGVRHPRLVRLLNHVCGK